MLRTIPREGYLIKIKPLIKEMYNKLIKGGVKNKFKYYKINIAMNHGII